MSSSLVGRLLAATGEERREAGLVISAVYQPVGGAAGRVMPPTYPPQRRDGGPEYLSFKVHDGEAMREDVVIDTAPSAANRVEEALKLAHEQGRVRLPMFAIVTDTPRERVRLTSLDFPHRYADAYLRDSLMDGQRFDETAAGKALRSARSNDARALFEREPYSLIYGAWDSHRKGQQAKFPRLFTSEMIGENWVELPRRAGRKDPLNLTGAVDDSSRAEADWEWLPPGAEKKKGGKLSELGHGHIAPGQAPGGGVVDRIVRRAWLSMAGLARVRFGDASAEAAHAARACLAALALLGDRLTFGSPSVWLRSGCDLTRISEDIGFEIAGGALEPLDVAAAEAIAAFEELRDRAAQAGLRMADDVIELAPSDSLRKAIEFATTRSTQAEE